MAKYRKHPFLFIEEDAKVWIRDDSSPKADWVGGDGNQQVILPPPEGRLVESLPFPLYMVRDEKGKDVPAEARVWDVMLIRRLLHGGDFNYHLSDSSPSKSYCLKLLGFHYSKISDSELYRFAPYLRQLLETEQANLEEQIRRPFLGDDAHLDMTEAFQSAYDLLQYCIDLIDKQNRELKSRLLKAKKDPNHAIKYTGKVKTLAYLILIKSGLVPFLSANAARHAQQEHIVHLTGLGPRTVELYIRATQDWNNKFYIYTIDNKDLAIEYIETIMPEINIQKLVFPSELRGAVQIGKNK